MSSDLFKKPKIPKKLKPNKSKVTHAVSSTMRNNIQEYNFDNNDDIEEALQLFPLTEIFKKLTRPTKISNSNVSLQVHSTTKEAKQPRQCYFSDEVVVFSDSEEEEEYLDFLTVVAKDCEQPVKTKNATKKMSDASEQTNFVQSGSLEFVQILENIFSLAAQKEIKPDNVKKFLTLCQNFVTNSNFFTVSGSVQLVNAVTNKQFIDNSINNSESASNTQKENYRPSTSGFNKFNKVRKVDKLDGVNHRSKLPIRRTSEGKKAGLAVRKSAGFRKRISDKALQPFETPYDNIPSVKDKGVSISETQETSTTTKRRSTRSPKKVMNRVEYYESSLPLPQKRKKVEAIKVDKVKKPVSKKSFKTLKGNLTIATMYPNRSAVRRNTLVDGILQKPGNKDLGFLTLQPRRKLYSPSAWLNSKEMLSLCEENDKIQPKPHNVSTSLFL